MALASPIERLRRIWTPDREVQELVSVLDPQTELDSMIRDFLHRTIEQQGPVTLMLEEHGNVIMNTGTLRWEIIHHEVIPGTGVTSRREVSLWVEESEQPWSGSRPPKNK